MLRMTRKTPYDFIALRAQYAATFRVPATWEKGSLSLPPYPRSEYSRQGRAWKTLSQLRRRIVARSAVAK
jgi:hypothetical protein